MSQVVDEIFGDAVVAANVQYVRRKSLRLSENEAFEFLANWIVPNANHASFRVSGQFVPGRSEGESEQRGILTSPVFDLLTIAKKINRLH